MTNGGLQGFVFFAQRLAPGGERVLVEQPTYDRPLKILARGSARRSCRSPMDDEGLDPDALEQALGRGAKPGVPLHDPDLPEPERPDALDRAPPADRRARASSTTCSCSRTIRTASSASRATRSRRCSSSTSGDRVVYASSFSKTVAPGVRVGYFVLPAALRAELEATSTSTYITPGLVGRRRSTSSSAAAASSRTSSACVGSSAPAATRCSRRSRPSSAVRGRPGRDPQGGYFVWLDVPGDGHRRAARPLDGRRRHVRPRRRLRRRAVDRAPRLQLRLAGRDPRGRAEASRAASVRGGALAATAAARRRARS